MPGRIPDQFIDDLLARVDIVDVVQERVALKKAGRDWSARCPFHDERSPSFTVSPAKQFYHCFGCGAHGSAIKFLMDYDRLEFVDAVEELAARAGVKVPHEGGARRAPQDDATDLYGILDATAKFYQRELSKSDKARAYFSSRGLDDATIERFGLGYAPDQWDALKSALGTTAARIGLLEKTGMLTSGERGTKYDRFRDRVMFPIQDRRGRVIAFGGRTLAAATPKKPADTAVREESSERAGDAATAADPRAQDTRKGDGPKYLNSPETPLFHKGRELFALWQVRQAHAKIPRLIVVEGYMDVIALFQHGITQAVATLGTATTVDHAELLFRNSSDVYFCFDGDRAGRQAAWRAVESTLTRMREGRQAFFLFLPDGEDPDSLVRKEGTAGFEARLKNATPLSDYFFEFMGAAADLSSADGRARLNERSTPLIKKIPEGGFRDQMINLMQEKIVSPPRFLVDVPAALRDAALEVFEEKLASTRSKFTSDNPDEVERLALPRPHTKNDERRTVVRSAVALLVQNPGFAAAIEPPHLFSTLRQPGIALLVELIALCRARREISTAVILEHFAERDEARALHKLAVMEFPGGEEEWRAEFLDALAQLDRQTLRQRTEELMARQASGALSADEKDELRRLLSSRNATPG
jgi:DNA primase